MQLGDLSRDICNEIFFNESRPLDLDTIDDQDVIIPLILRDAAGMKVDEKSVQDALLHLKSMEKQDAWHPLFAILVGHTLKKAQEEGQKIDVTAWNRRQLIAHYLTKNTRLPWKLKDNWITGIYTSAFIAAATARRGVDFRFLTQHKPVHPLATVDYNQVEQLCRTILSVPAIADQLPPFEPDILGETFFLLFIEAMQQDYDLLHAFKLPFAVMLSGGDEVILLNDAQEFIGFIARLTSNLCNDDQNDPDVEAHWQALLTFMNPNDFPAESVMRWAMSVALIRCAILIEELHLQKRNKEFDQLLHQVDINALCEVRKSEQLQISLVYAMRYYELIQQYNKKHQDIASKLINLCKDFEEIKRNKRGSTALMLASVYGYEAVARLLIEEGTDVNAKDTTGKTALMFASQEGRRTLVQLLVKENADINAKDKIGSTALLIATVRNQKAVSKLLIKCGAEVNAINSVGWSSLINAIGYGEKSLVRTLIEKGANVNVRLKHNNGLTALMVAITVGQEALAKLLVEKGADVNARLADRTTLMIASQYGCKALVQLLIEKGAEVNAQDGEGTTALMLASSSGHEAITQLLIEAGADASAHA